MPKHPLLLLATLFAITQAKAAPLTPATEAPATTKTDPASPPKIQKIAKNADIEPIQPKNQAPTPSEALEMLMHGNKHFADGEITHLSYITEAKDKMLEKQTPFAVIIGCSDSRVPPELIFDRGLGDLFVVRDAGNVIGPIELDSVEFAVEKLKAPLIMVLGHQNCGAVRAALVGRHHVPELESIYPLIDSGLKSCKETAKDVLINAIYCNVKKGMDTLKKSPTIAPLLAKNKVKIVGAYFNIETGIVTIISE